MTVVDHVKMVRNRPDIYFEHRIHEQLLPSIRRAGGDVAWTDIHVVHSGYDHGPQSRQHKLARDFRILALDLEERPDHPFVLFNLGMTHADAGQYPEAVAALERCLQVSGAEESHVRKAYALLVNACAHLPDTDRALQICTRGLQLFPQDPELLFRAAMLHHQSGRHREAVSHYRQAINGGYERYLGSVDPGISGYKGRHNLAVVLEELDELKDAEQQWRMVVESRPDYALGWRGLCENLLKQHRLDESEELIGTLVGTGRTSPLGLVLQAKVAMARGHLERAGSLLRQCIDTSEKDPEPRHELARFLFEQGRALEAEPILRQLANLTPGDPSVHHNLGTVYMAQGRFSEAVTAFQRSLDLRPESSSTRNLLASASAQLLR